MTAPASRLRQDNETILERALIFCAPIPALALGVTAMRHAGVPAGAWMVNVAAAVAGLLLLITVTRISGPATRRTQFALAAAGIVMILLPFTASGADGVYRWLWLGPVGIHASSIAAPLIIASVAAVARARLAAAVAIAALATTALALQPDAAQATSLAAACCTLIMFDSAKRRLQASVAVTLLVGLAMSSFVRPDPLPAVPHVEGILTLLAIRGTEWRAIGTATLLLLPLPFFVMFRRGGDRTSFALGVYVALITLAPFWGTFPVPIMGYGVSPIIGYFIALALSTQTPARTTRFLVSA